MKIIYQLAHRYNIHITEKHFTNLEAVLYKNRNITPHHKLLNFYHQNRHLDKKKSLKDMFMNTFQDVKRSECYSNEMQRDLTFATQNGQGSRV